MKRRIQYNLAWNWGGGLHVQGIWICNGCFCSLKDRNGNGEFCELQQKHEEWSTAQKVDNSYLSLD